MEVISGCDMQCRNWFMEEYAASVKQMDNCRRWESAILTVVSEDFTVIFAIHESFWDIARHCNISAQSHASVSCFSSGTTDSLMVANYDCIWFSQPEVEALLVHSLAHAYWAYFWLLLCLFSPWKSRVTICVIRPTMTWWSSRILSLQNINPLVLSLLCLDESLLMHKVFSC